MAKLYSSTMNLQAVFRSTAQAPLDNRQVVQTKADLINASTFEGFAYEGMLVVTADTSAVYVLNDIAKVTSTDYSGWTELATSAGATAAASVISLIDGNTAYVDLQTETAADGHKIYKLGLKIVELADATESNTGVADAYDVKSYVDSAIDGVEAIIEDNEEVIASALNVLKVTADDHESRISAIEDEIDPDGLIKDYAVTITPSTPADSADILKTYTFTQLGETIGTIDIPKDLVVTEGKTVEVVYDEVAQHYYDEVADPTHQKPVDALLNLDEQKPAGYAAGAYVRLSVANQVDPIYIKVTDLVDVYTGDATATRDIVVSVDPATNIISAAIGASSDLAAALVTLGEVEEKLEDIEEGVSESLAETNANVERVEKVASAALNDLNARLIEAEGAISGLPHIPATYLTNAITDSGVKTITVSATDHGCGAFPIVQVYAGNEVVNANITVDVASNSDVTVTWEIVPSASTPIRVRILG